MPDVPRRVEAEPVLLKHTDEALEGDRPKGGHAALLQAHGEAIYRHEFRGEPLIALPPVPGFAQDLIQRSQAPARGKNPADGVADVAAALLVRGAATRHVQSRRMRHVGIAFLKD